MIFGWYKRTHEGKKPTTMPPAPKGQGGSIPESLRELMGRLPGIYNPEYLDEGAKQKTPARHSCTQCGADIKAGSDACNYCGVEYRWK